ncbi:GAF domain-containing protein [Nocardioides sp.]|uniref:sensor histidine kinase n=1 Tax=Nocardioides sp. TaxID=35761 RepID=UPI003784BA7D
MDTDRGAPDAPEPLDDQQRWKLLLDAVVTLAADLNIDELLQRIVEIGADLAGARYVALGVLADAGARGDHRLQTFVTHGLTAEQKAAIGDLPRGHGLLGLLIDRPEKVRLHDIAAHPASVGFPAEHPPMRSFLGVPVRTGQKVFGNLYLSEKLDGSDFTEEDERIVVGLAGAAGVAIENARLHAEAVRRERWLDAAAEVTSVLLQPEAEDSALQVVADRARVLADADVAWVVAGQDAADLRLQVVSGLPADPEAMASIDLSRSLARSVVASELPIAVEDLAADPRAVDVADRLGWPELGPAIVVPLRSSAGVDGVVALAWLRNSGARWALVDPALPTRFAEQAALALRISAARRDEQRLALLEDRDRIARDLHDLVIQRLFAAGLGLQATAHQVGAGADVDVPAKLDATVDELDTTIRDIRRTIFALGSMDTGAADLQSAVVEVVERAHSALKFRPDLTFDGPVRTLVGDELVPDVLAVLTETLSNVARHAAASSVSVALSVDDGLRLRVADDGRGMAPDVAESGLSNMRRRAEARGGRLTIESAAGAGTCITWWVPLS